MARPSQRSWIFRCTAWMYHAYGKSDTDNVTDPAPWGEPPTWPGGGGGGGGGAGGLAAGVVAAAGAGAGRGGGGGGATVGSSLSPGRGSAAVRWGIPRSGNTLASRAGGRSFAGGKSRAAGRSRAAGKSRGGVRSRAGGSSRGFGGGAVSVGRVGGSTGRPTAATAGTRFTTYVFCGATCQAAARARITMIRAP